MLKVGAGHDQQKEEAPHDLVSGEPSLHTRIGSYSHKGLVLLNYLLRSAKVAGAITVGPCSSLCGLPIRWPGCSLGGGYGLADPLRHPASRAGRQVH
jgi:hypothetical protein